MYVDLVGVPRCGIAPRPASRFSAVRARGSCVRGAVLAPGHRTPPCVCGATDAGRWRRDFAWIHGEKSAADDRAVPLFDLPSGESRREREDDFRHLWPRMQLAGILVEPATMPGWLCCSTPLGSPCNGAAGRLRACAPRPRRRDARRSGGFVQHEQRLSSNRMSSGISSGRAAAGRASGERISFCSPARGLCGV